MTRASEIQQGKDVRVTADVAIVSGDASGDDDDDEYEDDDNDDDEDDDEDDDDDNDDDEDDNSVMIMMSENRGRQLRMSKSIMVMAKVMSPEHMAVAVVITRTWWQL